MEKKLLLELFEYNVNEFYAKGLSKDNGDDLYSICAYILSKYFL